MVSFARYYQVYLLFFVDSFYPLFSLLYFISCLWKRVKFTLADATGVYTICHATRYMPHFAILKKLWQILFRQETLQHFVRRNKSFFYSTLFSGWLFVDYNLLLPLFWGYSWNVSMRFSFVFDNTTSSSLFQACITTAEHFLFIFEIELYIFNW